MGGKLSLTRVFQELPDAGALGLRRISAEERLQLMRWVRAPTTAHRLVTRSQIVLLCADGASVQQVAARLRVRPSMVRLWRDRFNRLGVASLHTDASGRGRRPGIGRDRIEAVLTAMQALSEPGDGWSTRRIAARANTSAATVWRIWKHFGLGPLSAASDVDAALTALRTVARPPRNS